MPLPDSPLMVRSRLLVALGGPILMAVAVSCGGSDASTLDLSPQAENGRQIARTSGCSACHGGSGQGGTGPTWQGLYGSEVTLEDGSTVIADEAYLTMAIKDPAAQVVDGFSLKMPVNQLSDGEIADVVAYIMALGASTEGSAG